MGLVGSPGCVEGRYRAVQRGEVNCTEMSEVALMPRPEQDYNIRPDAALPERIDRPLQR